MLSACFVLSTIYCLLCDYYSIQGSQYEKLTETLSLEKKREEEKENDEKYELYSSLRASTFFLLDYE